MKTQSSQLTNGPITKSAFFARTNLCTAQADVKPYQESLINTSACLDFLSALCLSAYHCSVTHSDNGSAFQTRQSCCRILTHIAKKSVGHGLDHDRFGHGRGIRRPERSDGRETSPTAAHQIPSRLACLTAFSFHALP
jgi:hypothetical protein